MIEADQQAGASEDLTSQFPTDPFVGSRMDLDVDRELFDTFSEAFGVMENMNPYSSLYRAPSAPMLPIESHDALHQHPSQFPFPAVVVNTFGPMKWQGPLHNARYQDEKPSVDNPSRDKRRERNKVLARKTRMKKKVETECLRDRLVALMAENEKLRLVIQQNLPKMPAADMLQRDVHLPENIQRLVSQMLTINDRATQNEISEKQRSFCLVNPDSADRSIVYASEGFLELTGYSREDCIGRNCRFLQGADTDQDEVQRMREALIEQRDITVVLLNYHKDGTPFWNQIELAHLRDSTNKIRFIIGVQNKCDSQHLRVRLARQRSSQQPNLRSRGTSQSLSRHPSSQQLLSGASQTTVQCAMSSTATIHSGPPSQQQDSIGCSSPAHSNKSSRSNSSSGGSTTQNNSASGSEGNEVGESGSKKRTRIDTQNGVGGSYNVHANSDNPAILQDKGHGFHIAKQGGNLAT